MVESSGQLVLDIVELLTPGLNHDTTEDFKLSLRPRSQNQQFGGEVGTILGAMLPTGTATGATKEIRVATRSFEQARNGALAVMGEIGGAARTPNVGRVGELSGITNGFKTEVDDVFKMLRLDFDEMKGAHINVTVGKMKYSFEFPGTLEQVRALLKRNFQK